MELALANTASTLQSITEGWTAPVKAEWPNEASCNTRICKANDDMKCAKRSVSETK